MVDEPDVAFTCTGRTKPHTDMSVLPEISVGSGGTSQTCLRMRRSANVAIRSNSIFQSYCSFPVVPTTAEQR